MPIGITGTKKDGEKVFVYSPYRDRAATFVAARRFLSTQ
jgi:hypothetical protein